MTLKRAVSKRIKELLKEKKMTQYNLFLKSGVPQSTISTILKGETKSMQLSTLFYICAGIEVELAEFFDCGYLIKENLAD